MGVIVRSVPPGVVDVAVAMPVERDVGVGGTSSVPVGAEVLAADDCCVGAAGVAFNGIGVGVFSVSRPTGVKVSVESSSGVTDPPSGADLVALPSGPAITTSSSGVAAPPPCPVDSGVGVSVALSTPVSCCVDGSGVALKVAVSVGAHDTAVVDVKGTEVMTAGASPCGWPSVCAILPSH